jgi:hypothetical protein
MPLRPQRARPLSGRPGEHGRWRLSPCCNTSKGAIAPTGFRPGHAPRVTPRTTLPTSRARKRRPHTSHVIFSHPPAPGFGQGPRRQAQPGKTTGRPNAPGPSASAGPAPALSLPAAGHRPTITRGPGVPAVSGVQDSWVGEGNFGPPLGAPKLPSGPRLGEAAAAREPLQVQQVLSQRLRLGQADQVTAGQHVGFDAQAVLGQPPLELGREEPVVAAGHHVDRDVRPGGEVAG